LIVIRFNRYRADLGKVLLSPIPPSSIIYSKRLTSLSESTSEPGAIQLNFQDGGIATADVVIGAEGKVTSYPSMREVKLHPDSKVSNHQSDIRYSKGFSRMRLSSLDIKV
jgi:hypothetical protein